MSELFEYHEALENVGDTNCEPEETIEHLSFVYLSRRRRFKLGFKMMLGSVLEYLRDRKKPETRAQ